jgi:hypothetical protein
LQNITKIEKYKYKLPTMCKNGELFFDLVNKLEKDKSAPLIGFYSTNTNLAKIKANWARIWKHLEKYEKLNPRYFGKTELFLKEDWKVFWGFLDDLYHFFNKKVSKFDSRYEGYKFGEKKVEKNSGVRPQRDSRNSKGGNLLKSPDQDDCGAKNR